MEQEGERERGRERKRERGRRWLDTDTITEERRANLSFPVHP
jgi:hypothetical protein